MQLNHLDLQSHDVQTLATFFVAHFDFVRVTNDRSPALVVLDDGAGFTLALQRRTDERPYPDGFHLGFIHARAAAVEAHHARLTAAGVSVSPIDRNARGTRFYLRAPDEILIEVSSSER